MAWDDLTTNEVPDWNEIRAAVTEGRLIWSSGDPGAGTFGTTECLDTVELEAYILHETNAYGSTEVLKYSEIENTFKDLAPSTPSLTSVIANTSEEITVSWGHSGQTHEDGFNIDRKVGAGGSWTLDYATVGSNTFSYTDTNCTAGTTYYYRVSAYYIEPVTSLEWESADSAEGSDQAEIGAPSINPISDESVCTGNASYAADISWNATTTDSAFDTVVEYNYGTGWNTLTTVDASVQSYTHNMGSSPPGSSIDYRVYHQEDGGGYTTGTSGTATWNQPGSVCPSSPNPSATETSTCTGTTNTEVSVSWTNPSGWYVRVQRSQNGGAYSTITTTSTGTSYTDTSPGSVGNNVRYRARTQNASGTEYTNWDYTSTITLSDACPATPNPSATDNSDCGSGTMDYHVDVSWTNPSGWYVRLQRSQNGGTYSTLTTTSTGTTYSDASPGGDGDTVRYRARTQNFSGTEYTTWDYTSTITLEDVCPTEPTCSVPASPFTYGPCRVQCDVDAGNNCESIMWEYQIDLGGWTEGGGSPINTDPNTGGYNTAFVQMDNVNQDIEFRFTPYSGDNKGGTAGTTVYSGTTNPTGCI